MTEPHRVREMAESFGSDPDRYDRARPGYPVALIDAIVAAAPGRDVLDVGCGTGIASRQLQAAGCRVLGVDVDERMAELARRRGLEVEVASFESWDAAGRTFDAAVAAQTWHWIEPIAGAAKAAEALRPGGVLVACWNVPDPSAEVAEAFAAVYRRVLHDWNPWARPALDAYAGIVGKIAHGVCATGAFEEPEQWRFDWERSYTRAEWLDQLVTGGDVSRFSPAELQEVLAGVGAAVDELGGDLPMRYAAIALAARRL